MTKKFTQLTFSFDTKKDTNFVSPKSVSVPTKFVPITLLTGLDQTTIKNTSVYILRGLLGQYLRRSLSSDLTSLQNRRQFMATLSHEIKLKREGLDPIFLVRDALYPTS